MSLELLCFESFLDYSLNRFVQRVWKSIKKSSNWCFLRFPNFLFTITCILFTFSVVCLLFVYIFRVNNNFRAKTLKAGYAHNIKRMRFFWTFSTSMHAEFLDFWLSNRRIKMVARDNFSLRGIQWWWVDKRQFKV